MTDLTEQCCCGQPLHYLNPASERYMRELVAEKGALIPVQVPAGKWLVPRHYIALHGLRAEDVTQLAQQYGWGRIR